MQSRFQLRDEVARAITMPDRASVNPRRKRAIVTKTLLRLTGSGSPVFQGMDIAKA
jgi:hypothetical protein